MNLTMNRQGVKHRVHELRELSRGAFVVRADRHGLAFEPGQYINVGLRGEIDMREYSIYSGPDDDFLEILVKEVDEGLVSRKLHRVSPGDELSIDGPFGFFLIDEEYRATQEFLFIATGTGISPFRSFVRGYPELDYTLLHGVRYEDERYEYENYDANRLVRCISREDGGDYRGRVTDWLREHPVKPETICYLCGNCDMIYEAFDILKGHGVPPEQLYAEVYF
jgi:ferredoxin--NADP+ reductase/benzoate/toluate 1,2-dioxygenase reductase subunit